MGSIDAASLRGGFFRIHTDSSQKGYAVPRGSFGEYWADQFEKLGREDLAAQYRDSKKVLPEPHPARKTSPAPTLPFSLRPIPDSTPIRNPQSEITYKANGTLIILSLNIRR
ncbi:MAG: hypothetical protein M3Y08_16390 [Fibrobacterota bacterium]|nr:hypothetical protein [Fibrobacterota bacterium]